MNELNSTYAVHKAAKIDGGHLPDPAEARVFVEEVKPTKCSYPYIAALNVRQVAFIFEAAHETPKTLN